MPCLLCFLASALGVTVAANGKGPAGAWCYVRDFPGARTRTAGAPATRRYLAAIMIVEMTVRSTPTLPSLSPEHRRGQGAQA